MCVVPMTPPASAPTEDGGLTYVSAAESQLSTCGHCCFLTLFAFLAATDRSLAASRSNVANSS